MFKHILLVFLTTATVTYAQSATHKPQNFELQHGAPCQVVEGADTISITLRPKWPTPPPPDFTQHIESRLFFVKKNSLTPPNLLSPFDDPKVVKLVGNSFEPRPDGFMRITYFLPASQHEGGEFTLRYASFNFITPGIVGGTTQSAASEPVMLDYCVSVKSTIPIPPEQLRGDGIEFAPPHQ